MFKLVWRPALAAFSFILQYEDQKEIVAQVLDGVRCSIRLSGIFNLTLERDTFVQLLSRFSLLQSTSGLDEMLPKNIDAIKTLITVAYTDGNYLGETWTEVLQCISRLETLQLIGSGVKQEQTGTKLNPEAKSDLQKSLAETSIQSVVVAVDKVFAESCKLDGNAIVAFTKVLLVFNFDSINKKCLFCLTLIFSHCAKFPVRSYRVNRRECTLFKKLSKSPTITWAVFDYSGVESGVYLASTLQKWAAPRMIL